ncbi:MAG: hypothetical protein ACJAXS_002695, partial [Colwellia sp.]
MSFSLTISYHAICVGTHITLILHSRFLILLREARKDVKQF